MKTHLDKAKIVLSFAIGLATIAGIGWAVVYVGREFWSSFTQLNPTVAAGLLAAVATVLVSVVSVLYAKHLEQRIALQKEHREKKIPVYEDIIAFIFKVMYSAKEGGAELSTAEMLELHGRMTQKAIVWASDEVVSALHLFRFASLRAETDKLGLAIAMGELFLAIRRDLGHKNRGLYANKLLRLFINDVEKLYEL